MVGLSANDEWFRTLALIIKKRKAVAPRDNTTYEILNHTTCVDMTNPIVTYRGRDLGYKFMPAEAAFILTGRNTVGMISKYSNMISKFSDDGYFSMVHMDQ